MIVENTKVENALEHLKEYLNTRYDIAVLKVSDKGSSILSGLISYALLVVIGLFFLLFVSFGVALLISQQMGNAYSGFLIVAGFYLLLVVILLIVKDKLVKMPLLNMFVKQFCMEDKCDA